MNSGIPLKYFVHYLNARRRRGEKWAENLFRDIINENFTNNGERFGYPSS